jgi:hypothetical protein
LCLYITSSKYLAYQWMQNPGFFLSSRGKNRSIAHLYTIRQPLC